MPRIRTFKPEFFRSPDTAKASPLARILFLAMWSWADDEGVGETNLYGLRGFAFPDSDDLAVEEIPSLLKEISGSYGVLFYECRGRYFYAVPSWDKHQKTERRASSRHPKRDDPDSRPDLRFQLVEDLRGNSSAMQGQSALGTGEPGNRGNDTGNETEVCHQGADDVPPPDRCPKHKNTPVPPSCPGCGDARRFLKAWKQKREKAEADELERKRTGKAIATQAMRDCHLCDDDGWVLGEDGTPVEPAVKCIAHIRQESRHA